MPGLRDQLKRLGKSVGAYLGLTTIGNVGGGEDDLMSTTIPAGTLTETGDLVRITAWGTSANNVNAKTLKMYFGATAIVSQSLTASIAGLWLIEAIVARTGKDTQRAVAVVTESTNALAASKQAQEANTALAADEDASITVKCTGTGVADNDITQQGLTVEPYNITREINL